ncbi:MAG TPA: hypothetical protein VF463_08595 [Sphingobium sp.]
MPDWLSLLIDIWPVLSGATPIILMAGFYWLRTKFPTKEDFDKLQTTVTQLSVDQVKCNAAVVQLEAEHKESPTPIELMAQLATLAGRMSGVENRVDGVGKQVETANDYLQILIERGISR